MDTVTIAFKTDDGLVNPRVIARSALAEHEAMGFVAVDDEGEAPEKAKPSKLKTTDKPDPKVETSEVQE